MTSAQNFLNVRIFHLGDGILQRISFSGLEIKNKREQIEYDSNKQ